MWEVIFWESLSEVSSNLKPNHHSQVKFVQISDTHSAKHTQETRTCMISCHRGFLLQMRLGDSYEKPFREKI